MHVVFTADLVSLQNRNVHFDLSMSQCQFISIHSTLKLRLEFLMTDESIKPKLFPLNLYFDEWSLRLA